MAVFRILLILLNAFLAVTSVAGGIGLLTGAIATPLELLQGSPFFFFDDYTIPSLALLVIVGGSALAAVVLLLRRQRSAALASGLAGVMIMGFEVVEVLVIGSEPGVARNLQIFYFALGALILLLAIASWVAAHRA